MDTLSVRNLSTHFFTRDGVVKAVDDVSFNVAPGEILGLVGESGSGKSVLGFSLLGLVDPPGRLVSGQVLLGQDNVCSMSQPELRTIRGKRIAMIFQDPMMTLNPVLTIATQMIETIKAHEKVSTAIAFDRSVEALSMVGISAPLDRMQQYPHQLSGGMRQRVAIAMAVMLSPELIIADEPTTALDVTVQSQILFEVQSLCSNTGTSLIWISHDLSVVAEISNRVAVMYAGKIVEQGSVDDVLDSPSHPYTQGLLDSIPNNKPRGEPLSTIPGLMPSLLDLPSGCSFQPRCVYADASCEASPLKVDITTEHEVHCFHPRSMA